jgi:hypothetical protein
MTYDVFISFKYLDENGVPTRDASVAKEVYDFLVSKGVSVFMSTLTLETQGESDWMKAIDDALDGASVVIAVGTSTENLNSKFVRDEWSGFRIDILSGRKPKGQLFAYVESVLPTQLPRSLRHSQTFVHSQGSLQHLYGFVDRALHQDQKMAMPSPLPLEEVSRPEPTVSTGQKVRGGVFISYADEDFAYAEALSKAIVEAGLDVFWDRTLRAGDEWDETMAHLIDRCDFFVPIISVNTETMERAFFRREWYLASERRQMFPPDKEFILPVVVGELPDPKLIPSSFRGLQWRRMDGLTVPEDLVQRIRLLSRMIFR